MKGCARSCLLWLAGWAAASYAFYFYFVALRDFGPPMYWAAAIAGACIVVSVGFAIGILGAHRERSMLVNAVSGTRPEDGQWVAVSGTIQSVDPLVAPISGERAVIYEYKIQRADQMREGLETRVYFEGKALAPSTISTRHGTIRLLAVPLLDIPETDVPEATAIPNATAYLAATTFETGETPKEQRTTMAKEQSNSDGEFRKDLQHLDRDVDLADGFRFEEKCVRQGEQICAFGLFSQMRGGLIPHPNWAKDARIMRGDTAAVVEQLRGRIVKFAIGIFVSSAIAYGIVRFYEFKALSAAH